MKTLSPSFQAHLDSGATHLCWCWRLTRADGVKLGFTDHDRDLTFDGTAFEAASGFSATEVKDGVGLSVDNLDVSGALSSAHLNEDDLAAGLFDDARVEIWRVRWDAPEDRVLMRAGSLGEVRREGAAFTAEVRGLAHYLNQETGRTYQYGCDAALGDARCGVNLSLPAYRGVGAVVSASGHRLTVSGLEAFASGWFSGGLIAWTSGANAGRTMEVRTHAGANLELWQTMAAAVAPGDAFTITAGCDKTFAACRAKFANGLNFRGFPHIPGNNYVMAPVSTDGQNDGAARA
ncbi:MAG: DUF2163 domain-containing protein [Hyphomicrobiales bacterium]|nr:DUF2163 domain-containing protein [Hyphomicrobiales bacterium]